MQLRDEMQKIALESPRYGHRRITAELQRRNFHVNHKRLLCLLRKDPLLCVRRRAFAATTDSRHSLPVYPKRARDMQVTVVNPLWVAEITCIRLREELVCLSVLLDAYSRRLIGGALGRRREADRAISALRLALLAEVRHAPTDLHDF
jgi:putative transposase